MKEKHCIYVQHYHISKDEGMGMKMESNFNVGKET
jgi:hypothetical protein